MQSLSVFLDITKFADFQWKNADVSRNQGVFHVIHIFFGFSLGKVNCAMFHQCRICVTDFREGGLFGQPHPWAALKMPFLNRVKDGGFSCIDLLDKFEIFTYGDKFLWNWFAWISYVLFSKQSLKILDRRN